MIKLFKLHLKYFYNKVNIIILSILIMICIIALVVISRIFKPYSYRFMNQYEIVINYQIMTINLTKIIFPLFTCYLFGSSFLKINDDYRLIMLKNRKDRIKYFLSKLVVLSLIVLIFSLIINSIYLLLGYLGIPNFTKYGIMNLTFLKVYFISLIYGLLSLLIVLISDHSLGYLLMMISYIIIQIMGDTLTLNIIFFPYLKEYQFSINIVLIVSEFIMLLFGTLMRYYYMDM